MGVGALWGDQSSFVPVFNDPFRVPASWATVTLLHSLSSGISRILYSSKLSW
jgi:hypothetical protein